MPSLDVPTLLFVLGTLVSVGGVAIILLWRENEEEPGLGALALACLAGAVAGFLAGTYGKAPAFFSVFLADVATTLCFCGFAEGLRRFYGGRPRTAWLVGAAGVHGAASGYWTWFAPNPGARAVFTGVLMVAFGFLMTATIWRGARREIGVGSVMLVLCGVGFCTVAVHQVLSALGPSTASQNSSDIAVTDVLAAGMILSILLLLAGLFMTISERHVERLEVLRRRAEAGERSKAGFLAVMSHEIRTPMNGVLGLSELLLGAELSPKQRQLTLSIRSSGRILLRILDDVLDLSKIEAGRVEIEHSAFRIRDLVGEVRQLIRGPAARKSLTLGSDIAGGVPPAVLGDPVRIGQVLLNLLGNAVKFTEAGGVTLRISAPEGDVVRFEIIDTGIGITEEGLGRLFQPFQQTESSIGRRFGGTGLGLAISKQLVELMGGRIEVKSRYGRGSTFSVSLPLPATEDMPETDEISLRQVFFDEIRSVADAPSSRDPRSLRILVAEDDPVSQMVAQGLLEGLGLACDVVSDGDAALGALATAHYDLVFMDCHMPKLDGFEATTRLRATAAVDAGPRLPVIALTAGVMSEERERCFAVGMDDVVSKPVSTQQLAAVLERWLPVSLAEA